MYYFVPCSIFTTSNGTPPNYTHFGRGDNWNFPDTVKSEHGNYALTSRKNIWEDKVKSYFPKGYTIQQMQNVIENLLQKYQLQWKNKQKQLDR